LPRLNMRRGVFLWSLNASVFLFFTSFMTVTVWLASSNPMGYVSGHLTPWLALAYKGRQILHLGSQPNNASWNISQPHRHLPRGQKVRLNNEDRRSAAKKRFLLGLECNRLIIMAEMASQIWAEE
jgi:hypothetical protein